LAYHCTKSTKNIETKTCEYLHTWEQKYGSIDKGVQLANIPDLEELFQVGVNIYIMHEGEVIEPVYRTATKCENILNLNLYNNHLSYITDFQMYGKKYKCRNCDKLYGKLYEMTRHEKCCKEATTFQYPGGFYSTPPTIFDILLDLGYEVPESDHY
jgi:hypothetical protein